MKKPVFYLLVFLIIVLISGAVFFKVFETPEMIAYDWMMKARPAQKPHPEIVIIEIADDTLKGLGQWPLLRDYHAALIDALTESGCRMIIFDILLSEETKLDYLSGKAMQNSGRVLLPIAFRIEEQDNPAGIPVSSEIIAGVAPAFKEKTRGVGHINIFVDSDGKVRRLPLLVRYAGKLWPSLGLLAASQRLGRPLKAIPVDSDGAFWINYPGRWTRSFPHFSYLDVLKSASALKDGKQPWLDLSVFKDKICFVGLTAAGTSDLRANSFDTVYPMVGAQASVCDSILRQSFIRRVSGIFRVLIASFVFVLALWICLNFSVLTSFLSCFLLAAAYAVGVWCIFAFRGILPDFFLPLFITFFVYCVILARKFFQEAQKRRLLEQELEIAFSIQRSFLPADIRQLAGVHLRSYLKPAKFVGGDFYDIITLDESTLGFFIADVCGKGVSAALIMAQSISFFRVLAKDSRDPARVLFLLNNQLKPLLQGRFVTAQYIIFKLKE